MSDQRSWNGFVNKVAEQERLHREAVAEQERLFREARVSLGPSAIPVAETEDERYDRLFREAIANLGGGSRYSGIRPAIEILVFGTPTK